VSIKKLPSGKWFAELKAGRTYVGGKAFDSKREAQAWYERERAALAGGVDPRAGRATVRTLLPVWLDERRHSVSAKTYTADAALPRLVPTGLAALRIAAVTDREVSRALVALSRKGLAESSVRRFRASLSSFFAWAVRERMIVSNPVALTRVPKSPGPRTEMYPLSEADLEEVYAAAAERDQRLADLLLIDAWTGLRWSELRAIRVRDFIEVPLPVLIVQRAAPEAFG
jgi:integrase